MRYLAPMATVTLVDWDQRYRENNTPWDRAAPAPALLEYLDRHEMEGRILVPGCGTGHDAAALASPNTNVIALDVSRVAIQRAAKYHAARGVKFRIGNFLQLDDDLIGEFDWVVEHTFFCSLDPSQRLAYVKGVHAALRPLGTLFAIFFLNPQDSEKPGYEGPPWPVTVTQLDELFDPQFDLLEQHTPDLCFEGREDRELVRIYRRR